jgi:hypothetical protein
MADVVMRKYRKIGAQLVKEVETNTNHRDGENCVDVCQRVKRNTPGLRTFDTVDMTDILKGILNLDQIHRMLTFDTSKVTMDELEEYGMSMGRHLDQSLSSKASLDHSPLFST